MHERPALLLAVVLGRGARDEETAVQVHGDHRQPVVGRHPVEDHVAQDAGIVHHAVDAAVMVECRLDDLLRRAPLGDGLGADFGGAALLLDQLLGLLRLAWRSCPRRTARRRYRRR